MCANIPQQGLEQRPNDAAEDHSPDQPGAVCKATISTIHNVLRKLLAGTFSKH